MKKGKVIKIAVVEDDLFFRSSVLHFIKKLCQKECNAFFDFEISLFEEPEDAILELEDDLNIMLLDYHFGSRGGEQLTGEDVLFAVNQKCSNCEVILISGQTEPELITRLKGKGIKQFIDKNKSNIQVFGSTVNQSIQNLINA